MIKAISEAAHKACIDKITTDVGENCFAEEMKIQQKNTEHMLTIMSAKIKNWVYK